MSENISVNVLHYILGIYVHIQIILFTILVFLFKIFIHFCLLQS